MTRKFRIFHTFEALFETKNLTNGDEGVAVIGEGPDGGFESLKKKNQKKALERSKSKKRVRVNWKSTVKRIP